jgi:hypothetical protein
MTGCPALPNQGAGNGHSTSCQNSQPEHLPDSFDIKGKYDVLDKKRAPGSSTQDLLQNGVFWP